MECCMFGNLKKNLNVQIGDHIQIKDAAELVGGLFGEQGRQIGRAIDDMTKDTTIKIGGSDRSSSSPLGLFRNF